MIHSVERSNNNNRLQLNERILTPQEASLCLWISTEGWDERQKAWLYGEPFLKVQWNLEIQVDEQSGEDGTPAPSLCYYILGSKLPPLAMLPGMRLDDPDNNWCEAWYGNDAPELTENTLTFGDWATNDHIYLRWSAKFNDWDTGVDSATFLFDGLVHFTGIKMKVKNDNDAGNFLKLALPLSDLSELNIAWEEWQILSDDFPEDRRKWHWVTWSRK
ncbi:MAG: hypothetical protein LBE81_08020 [Azonexus sp.]|jgi:hypothetical protein|uniref:hypothetical protein n=1 Tax=Azonexus sp. TaxID=1872668 RepID=UPI0028294CBD|nr:hypothetical protein [Azonexus sp.]MDR0776568.1 hypothetical protein [Azonexus sp.]